LTVWLQSQCHVKVLKKLSPTVFWPRPQVDSAIVRITADAAGREALGDRIFFQDFVRRLFHQRRKYLRSVLSGMYRKELSKSEIDRILEPFGFPEGVRAEELDVPTLVRLARAVDATVGRLHVAD
jgi:16S rRNA (adenine1518-N6/adenine1519-N6)-dimethyltransferase